MKDGQATLRRLTDLVDYLVDDRVGIIKHVGEVPREAGAPDFFHFAARACNTAAFNRLENFRNSGGASADRTVAMAKAIGEAVERYCSALFDIDTLPLSSFEAAPFPCVRPAEFALYSAAQHERPGFPWAAFDDATPVRWTPALDLETGQTCYVPAAKVFVPYVFYQGTDDTPIVQPISTGLACHCSPTEAAIAGITEVIERDAFTIAWQARLAMPQIRIETLSDANYDLVDRFERAGGAVTMLDITLDIGVPTVLSVLRSDAPGAPPIVFAAASALDPEEAARKSLEELAHTRRYTQQIKTYMPRLMPDPDHEHVIDQVSHLNFWCDEANLPLADFVFASRKRIAFDEIANLATGNPERDLAVLVEKVRAVDQRVLLADLTTPDVGELGLAVARAIIPGFHPLFMGYSIRALGGRRLWEAPQALGYVGIAEETGDNPAPHPYP